jgi:nicotinamidase-related amidase
MGLVEPRVVFAGAAFRRTLPVLVLMDLHEEALAALGRPPTAEAKDALENCARLLEAARVNGVPVAHCRRIGARCSEAERSPPPWLKGFAPRTSEMVFERELLSCYTAAHFDRLLRYLREPRLLLAGLSTGAALLATALDAHDRAHCLNFVADASASPSSAGPGQTDLAVQAIDRFAVVIGTAAALAAMVPFPWEKGP